MAQSVSASFLNILEADARTARRRLVVLVLLAAMAALACVTVDPWAPLVFIGAAAAGIGMGVAWGNGRARRREETVRSSWLDLMDRAPTASDGRALWGAPRMAAWLVLAGALWGLQVGGIALIEIHGGLVAGMPLLVLDGLVLGLAAGVLAMEARWSRRFSLHITEMVAEGDLEVVA